jgi:hypothetical protein
MNRTTIRCVACCYMCVLRAILVASRPRIGGYSQARTLVHSYVRMSQLDRTSWKGTAGQGSAISDETGTRPTGFPMCICICPSPGRIDSNKQCFHNQSMHTCLLRATILSTRCGHVIKTVSSSYSLFTEITAAPSATADSRAARFPIA